MRTCPDQARSRRRFLWRRLVGAVAIYALVMQPLLLIVAESQSAPASTAEQSFSELCLHDANDGPGAPSDQQRHPAHQHCLQCFNGAFHLLGWPQPATFAFADRDFSEPDTSGRALRLPSSSPYSIASPRGPPVSA